MPTQSKSKSGPVEGSAEDHTNPHAFERVPGPGPKDGGKGAAGAEAIERLEGGPKHAPEAAEADDDANDEGGDADGGR